MSNKFFATESSVTKTLEDILGSNSQATMMRLKAILLGLTKTPAEYKTIGFLCDGYKEMDIADALKCSRQYVNKTIKTFRNRLKLRQVEEIFSLTKEG